MILLILPALIVASGSTSIVVVAILGGLFGGGGLVAFVRARQENRKLAAEADKTTAEKFNINIDAAQGAVVVQSSVIKDLADQLDRYRTRLENYEKTIEQQRIDSRILAEKCDKLQDQLNDLIHELAKSNPELLLKLHITSGA